MEYSQLRDGRFVVYENGDWVGMVGQLPTGSWLFLPRLTGDGTCTLGLTIDGALEIWKSTRSSTTQDEREGLGEDENGIFIATRS